MRIETINIRNIIEESIIRNAIIVDVREYRAGQIQIT